MTDINEKELLLRIAEGDEPAFHSIYLRYFGKVYGMSLSYLPDVFMAQDIVQEVFARVWLNRAELPGIRNMEAWIITIARNLLIKSLRKIYPSGWDPAQTDSSDPHETLDYRELERLLTEAVGKLSNRQQEVYRLSRVEGYSHKEISDKLGISVDVSREHLSKALHNIRVFLREMYGPLGILTSLLLFI